MIIDPYCFNNPDCFVDHGFKWQEGVLADLGTLGGSNSQGFWINDKGQIQFAQNGMIDPLLIISSFMRSFGVPRVRSLTLELSEDMKASRRRSINGDRWSDWRRIRFPIPTLYFSWDNKRGRFCGIRRQECRTWAVLTGCLAMMPRPVCQRSRAGGGVRLHQHSGESLKLLVRPASRSRRANSGSISLGEGQNDRRRDARRRLRLRDRSQQPGSGHRQFELSGDLSSHGFRWDKKRGLQDLATLGGIYSGTHGINDAGDAVGWADLAGDVTSDAVIWPNGTTTPIDLGLTAGFTQSVAVAINSKGQIIGCLTSDPNGNCFPYDFGFVSLGKRRHGRCEHTCSSPHPGVLLSAPRDSSMMRDRLSSWDSSPMATIMLSC